MGKRDFNERCSVLSKFSERNAFFYQNFTSRRLKTAVRCIATPSKQSNCIWFIFPFKNLKSESNQTPAHIAPEKKKLIDK